MSEFNDWFCSLPDGRQAILRDDKWRLADFAFQAGFKQAQAEIDALKAQRDALLAAQEGTPCKHKFHVDAGSVLFCVYCSASFSEQKEAIAKARGDL